MTTTQRTTSPQPGAGPDGPDATRRHHRRLAVRRHLRHLHRRQGRLLPAAVRRQLRHRPRGGHPRAVGSVRRVPSSSSPTSAPPPRMYTVIKRRYPNLALSFVAARDHGVRLHRCRHPGRPHRRDPAPGLRRQPTTSPQPAWPRSATRSSPCRSGPSTSAPRSSSASATAASSATSCTAPAWCPAGWPCSASSAARSSSPPARPPILGLIEPDGAIQQLSAAPEFIWELGLGIYLIVKGFKTPNANTDRPRRHAPDRCSR